jgi:hypothetical protein
MGKAYYQDMSFGKAFIVPVRYDNDIYYRPTETKLSIPISALTYLMFYKTKNKVTMEVITSIPRFDAADTIKSQPFKGIILVEKLNGEFIKGFNFSYGTTKATSAPVELDAESGSHSSGKMDITCYSVPWYYCVGTASNPYQYCNQGGYDQVCSISGDGSGGSGGTGWSGGGGSGSASDYSKGTSNLYLTQPGQENPAIDLASYLNCFGNYSGGDNYKITLFVEEPNPGTGEDKVGTNVGHTFIGVTKVNNGFSTSIYFGFYPLHSTLIYPTPSKIVDNSNHHYTVSSTYDLTYVQFSNVINNAILSAQRQYSIDDFNCTTYAIGIFEAAGISLPTTKIDIIWPFGSAMSPGTLGLDLRNLKTKNPNFDIRVGNRVSGLGSGPCGSSNEEE